MLNGDLFFFLYFFLFVSLHVLPTNAAYRCILVAVGRYGIVLTLAFHLHCSPKACLHKRGTEK